VKTFYLTTPIYYPNARPHVGSAYTTIVCDVIARYKRMCGYDVAFLTGTDEHGEKLQRAAQAAGVSPQEFVDEKRKLFVSLWEKLGIPVSVYPGASPHALRFIYTTHPDHAKSVQRMLTRAKDYPLHYCRECDLYVHGVEPPNCPKCGGTLEWEPVIYKRQYQGRYCISDERYISDGTDPATCDICGRPAELISEENYFFRLSAFAEPLLDLYQKHPEFVRPDYRRNEVMSFVKSGLRDISISRKRLKWGIRWPDDPEQVFYVWYDALTSYMTGIGYAQGENGSPEFQKYWRNDSEGEIVHMIGKDILRFHAVYWPAFLMAAYPDQPEMLPTTVFAHGWIYYEQDKMSKSKGNVVYPEPIVDALDSFGAPGNDALRYYLLRESPFGQDMSFSYEALIQRYNSDLANGLGNLASRTLTMLKHDYAGEVPSPIPGSGVYAALAEGTGVQSKEERIVELAADVKTRFQAAFDSNDFSRALDAAWSFISEINKYLVEEQPWSKTRQLDTGAGQFVTVKPEHLQTVLYTATAALRFLAVLLSPVMPHACQKLWKQLGCEGKVKNQRIDQLKWGGLKPGTQVGKAEPIFPRLDKAATLAKLDELAEADRAAGETTIATVAISSKEASTKVEPQPEEKPVAEALPTPNPESRTPSPGAVAPGFSPASSAPAPPVIAPQPDVPAKISIEDFTKVEMRVGQILSAEPIPKATKLLKIQVDIGSEVRQVCAGIAEQYRPEDLVGMKVVVVANLQPRKLRGVESNGMIVAASVGEEGRPILVTFKEDVPNGTRLK
jgi:methionyl-tRNA synthetase